MEQVIDVKQEIKRGMKLMNQSMKDHYLSLYYDWCVATNLYQDAKLWQEESEALENFKLYFMKFILGYTYFSNEAKFYKKLDTKQYNAIESGIFDYIEKESGLWKKAYSIYHEDKNE